MIIGTKVIGLPDLFNEGEPEQQFVQVQFGDGGFVTLNEEELKNAAVSSEKESLNE
jgi:hypothetical protein|tara:strand:- start:2111 stop:2278 length:168 start_codon:yes stop_codon:yes gene_type:complete